MAKPKTRIGQLVHETGLKYEDIAEQVCVNISMVKSWMQGIHKPDYNYIEAIADILHLPVFVIDRLFYDAYSSKHNDPKQESIFDEHMGQCQDFEDNNNKGTNFNKWYQLFMSHHIPEDVLAHLMYLYTQYEYNMWDAIEALHHEHDNLHFLTLRKIVTLAAFITYFGEGYEV